MHIYIFGIIFSKCQYIMDLYRIRAIIPHFLKKKRENCSGLRNKLTGRREGDVCGVWYSPLFQISIGCLFIKSPEEMVVMGAIVRCMQTH